MTDNKLANRIPFENIQTMEAWKIPNVTGNHMTNNKKVVSKKHTETIEEVRPEDLKAVTAEQLQKVSEAAEQEGREKGYQEGLQQGFTEGEIQGKRNGEAKAYAETKQALDDKMQYFQSMADALLDPVNMQDADLENTIIDMAVHLTKHLINRELSEDPSSVFKIVERAVNSLPTGAKNIRIYLHADDAELAHEAFESSGKDWDFCVDAQLSRGGCRVETEQSLIDYSVEHRLQTMLDKINFQGDVDAGESADVGDYRPVEEAGDSDFDYAEVVDAAQGEKVLEAGEKGREAPAESLEDAIDDDDIVVEPSESGESAASKKASQADTQNTIEDSDIDD